MATPSTAAGRTAPLHPHNMTHPGQWRSLKQFVCYSIEVRGNRKTKVPKSCFNGGNAKTNDPSTWGTLKQASDAVETYGFHGVGFVFSPSGKYVFIDLDGCVDPETGTIAPWAQEIVEELNSYTAISISGSGLHVYVEASEGVRNHIGSGRKRPVDAQPHGDKKPGVEISCFRKPTPLGGRRQRVRPRARLR